MNVISAQADLFTGSRLPKIIILRRDGLPTASRQRRRPAGPKPACVSAWVPAQPAAGWPRKR
jgi:hypothetical protein